MVWQKQEEEGCKSLIMTAAILGALLGTFWSRGHQEGRMSTRDLASIKWRERETPQGLLATRRLSFFLAFFELSKYVYIYRLQPFLLHEQTIAAGWQFHKLVWKGKILDFFIPFFILDWLLRQLSIPASDWTAKCQWGIKSSFVMISQILFWSACFFYSLKVRHSLQQRLSDVNICYSGAWQKKDYHPVLCSIGWKLEPSFIFCTFFRP